MRTESPSVRDAATFDFNAPMVVITTQEIIEGLERFAAIHGKPSFRQKDFMAWKDRPFDMQTVVNRFGSWRKALAEIGGQAGHPGSFSSEELIANLESVWRQLGRRPSINQLKPRGICGAGPYQRRWGSVRRACRRLAAYHRGEISREELLRDEPRDPRITRKPSPRRTPLENPQARQLPLHRLRQEPRHPPRHRPRGRPHLPRRPGRLQRGIKPARPSAATATAEREMPHETRHPSRGVLTGIPPRTGS
jgi:hypothetical protein